MDRAIDRSDDADDAAIRLSPTSMPRFQLGGTLLSIAAVAAVFIGTVNLHHGAWRVLPGELVWPIPPDVYAAAIFVATFLIILNVASALVRSRAASPFRPAPTATSRAEALILGSVFLISALCCVARFLTQLVGFAGLHSAAVPVAFDVVDTDSYTGRSSTSHYYLLRLRYGPAGRTFDDEVRKSVFDAARQGDTVVIPVETGRFGLQRAMIDAAPVRVADLHHAATPAR